MHEELERLRSYQTAIQGYKGSGSHLLTLMAGVFGGNLPSQLVSQVRDLQYLRDHRGAQEHEIQRHLQRELHHLYTLQQCSTPPPTPVLKGVQEDIKNIQQQINVLKRQINQKEIELTSRRKAAQSHP